MHILLLGAKGQLGQAVVDACSPNHLLTLWGREEGDISRPEVSDKIRALNPDLVINCAAWTQVDQAEADVNGAYSANALGPFHIATACANCDATLVHISTNEVFAGVPGRFYYEFDQPSPSSVYARSKAGGEVAASRVLTKLFIVRVAWLFGPKGVNFPSKIVAAADRNGALKVVNEEFGNPTYTPDVAEAIFRLAATDRYGIYHLVNSGYASRYDFAKVILESSGRGHIPLSPIALGEWPRPAPPPPHAVLVNQVAASMGISLRPWQEAAQEFAERYLKSS